MFAALHQRDFALLWFGQLVSIVGDRVLLIALPFYVYAQTGSALATGAMFIAQIAPGVLLGSVAGVFADRWDRRRTMLTIDLARAALILLLIAVPAHHWYWMIYLVAAAQAALGQFFDPAKSALLPRLVFRDQLMAANALNQVSYPLTGLLGAFVGGALLTWLGLSAVVLVDSGTFLVSAAMIVLMRAPSAALGSEQGQPARRSGAAPGVERFWAAWRGGLRLVRSDAALTGVFVVVGIAMIAQGVSNVLFVAFVQRVLMGNAQTYALLSMTGSIGGLVGGMLLRRLAQGRPPSYLMASCEFAAGLGFLALLHLPLLPLVFVFNSLMAAMAVGSQIGSRTILQTRVADAYQGRVFGAFSTVLALLQLAGTMLASGLGDRLGTLPMLNVAGGLLLAAGAAAFVTLRGQPMEVMASTTVQSRASGA